MDIKLKLHTIILTIGPSGCGKTYFTQNTLIPALKSFDPDFRVQYISSDDLRREVLDKDLDKMDTRMMYASDAAFKELHHRLDTYMSFPINSEFIIVDSTGLSDEFINKIVSQASKNNYHVTPIVFQYNNRDEYTEGSTNLYVTNKHLRKLNREILPNLKKSRFNGGIVRVKSKYVEDINLEIPNHNAYKSCQLTGNSDDYVIIGDIHGCYKEFRELLLKNKIIIDDNDQIVTNDKKIILVGDYIDKNSHDNIEKTVNFIHKNLDKFIIVQANHENYVFKKLKGQIEGAGEEIDKKYFNSLYLFQENTDLATKFEEIFKKSVPFVKHDHFFVTHAPCNNKHIGKLDRESLKKQRNYVYPRRDDYNTEDEYIDARNEAFKFIETDSVRNHPYVIFGHVMSSTFFKRNNYICIDQGCASGGRLTSIVVNGYNSHFIQSVYNDDVPREKMYPVIIERDKWEEFDLNQECERKEASRIKFCARNGVNFISGTVSPSDKEEQSLETIDSAVEYYKRMGVEKLVVQPKYMGSRCQVYLKKNIDECYAVSRSGYKIRYVDLTKIYEDLHRKQFVRDFFDKENGQVYVLDGELMPWNVLGKGRLIDGQFRGVSNAVKTEQDYLKESGFYDILADYHVNEYERVDYVNIHHEMSKKEADKLLGDYRKRKTMEAYHEFLKLDINYDDELSRCEVFQKQIDLFGGDGELEFKPFAILKKVYSDKEIILTDINNSEQFGSISEDSYLVVDVNDSGDITKLNKFYEDITVNENMEGVVVKPLWFEDGVAPMLKVRNPKYLTLVYGYDYTKPSKYEKLLKRKSTGGKMRLSIKEFETGIELLKIPYNEIQEDNVKYQFYVHKFISDESKEKTIDPRL